MSFDYEAVPGDYQYRALHAGPRLQRFWHAGKLDLVDHLVRPHLGAGARLLEIGCGSGNLLLRAAVRGSFPVALDVATPPLTFVRARLQLATRGPDAPAGFACIRAAGETLPFATASFDCVLLSEVIEHLPQPERTVREAARVLRAGGRLLVTTPNYRSFWPVLERVIDLLRMTPPMAGEQHITRFGPASLRHLLLDAGLEIEHFGTIYAFSPLLALGSPPRARRRLTMEIRRRSLTGMILAVVAVKPAHTRDIVPRHR